MGELFIERGSSLRTTGISNVFIDEYMAETQGDYVKVYLYLMRCFSDRSKEVSIEAFAGALSISENDVYEAMRYWQEQDLITVCFNDLGEMTGIRINECVSKQSNSFIKPEKRKLKASDISAKIGDESFAGIVYAVSTYLGKQSLTQAETNSLIYIIEDLGFSEDLTLYLVEHCVESGHKRMSFIEKLAITWAEAGVESVVDAREYIRENNPNIAKVLKAFGITGRTAGIDEKAYINKWFDSFGFSTEVVLCACNKTINKISTPSFQYADSILTKWHSKGISSLEDVEKDDLEFKQTQSDTFKVLGGKSSAKASLNANRSAGNSVDRTASADNISKRSAGGFCSFPQREYDYEEIERRALARRL